MNKEEGRVFVGKVNPAVLAIWAALVVVSKFIPAVPMLGTGSTFSISIIMFPLAGILFGPVSGMIIAIVGGVLSQFMGSPAWMGPLTFLIGTVSAGCAGFAVNKKAYVPIGVILLGTALWFTHPVGKQVPLFPAIFYTAGLVASVICAIWGHKLLTGEKQWGKFLIIASASYCAFVASAAVANYFGGLRIFQIPPETWTLLAIQAPIERLVFSLASASLGVSLFFGLPKIGLYVGPQKKD